MARGRKPHPDNYGLDFESAAAERHAQLVSALTITGMQRYVPLARLVLNMQERSGGAPLGWPVSRYAEEFGRGERTIQYWLAELASIGILEIEPRPRQRGGQATNLVSINWRNVRTFAVNRAADPPREQGAKTIAPRPAEIAPRPAEIAPPIKEYPSCLPSLEPNTTTTTALPHAPTLPHASPVLSEEEEEVFQNLVASCRQKIPNCPIRIEQALRAAWKGGCTLDELRERCAWFRAHRIEWPAEHRAGAFYTGIAEALPGIPADRGWPYQRSL